MPQVFVYEFVTAGGLGPPQQSAAAQALLPEGRAMLAALRDDFAAIPGVRAVSVPDGVADRGAPDLERDWFLRLARESDWTVLIAPEIGGALLERCRMALAAGGRLLGPCEAVILLATDKHATAEHLRSHGVPAPMGVRIEKEGILPMEFDYPAVLKPLDGAGSQGVALVASREAAQRLPAVGAPSRLERFCPGIAASTAVICGRSHTLAMLPCRQHLTTDGRFEYLGGSLPLPAALAQRAEQLALRAVAALPAPLGYLGVDLVLGDDPCGADDVVIEINPRLTTSYIGLRAAARSNLAEVWMRLVEGETPSLAWNRNSIEFSPTGTTTRAAPSKKSDKGVAYQNPPKGRDSYQGGGCGCE